MNEDVMEAIKALLQNEAEGHHGESERRCIGQFLLDACEEVEEPRQVWHFAQYLATVARLTAEEISRLVEETEEPGGFGPPPFLPGAP